MKKSMAHCLVAGVLVAAPLLLAAPASAQAVGCGIYRPGLIAYLTRPALCSYQGDRIAHQGPTYDGPAIVAPQPTYSPSRTVSYGDYPYRAQRVALLDHASVRRSRISADDSRPARGKVQVVRARAEVRIYGPDRMDIRLYRR